MELEKLGAKVGVEVEVKAEVEVEVTEHVDTEDMEHVNTATDADSCGPEVIEDIIGIDGVARDKEPEDIEHVNTEATGARVGEEEEEEEEAGEAICQTCD